MNKFDQILGDIDASVNLAVKNLEVSKKFYEDTLGLTQIDTEEELIVFKSGNTLSMYISRRMPEPTRPPRSPSRFQHQNSMARSTRYAPKASNS